MKILPFADKPIFLCYHNKAFPTGVIAANSPIDITKWVCAKSVKLEFFPQLPITRFVIRQEDIWGVKEGICQEQIIQVNKALVPRFHMDVLHILRTALTNDCYVGGHYNEKYIPHMHAYQQTDFMHDFMLIGYEDHEFIAVGYVGDGRFKQFTIPVENMVNSLSDITEDNLYLILHSYNKGAIPTPDIPKMITHLKNYLAKSDTADLSHWCGGISVNGLMKDFFIEAIRRGRTTIDRRYARVFLEHKWVLSKIVELFLDESLKRTELLKYTKDNFSRAETIHLLGLKMGISGNTAPISRIAELMEEIVTVEENYLPPLVDLLERKYL